MKLKFGLALAALVAVGIGAWLLMGEVVPDASTGSTSATAQTSESATTPKPGTKSPSAPAKSKTPGAEAAKSDEVAGNTNTPKAPRPNPAKSDDALAGLDTRDATLDELKQAGLPEKAKGGVVITYVDPRAPAAEAQLKAGDIIYRAHHSDVTNVEDLSTAVGDRRHTLLNVYRGGRPFQVVIHKPYQPDSK